MKKIIDLHPEDLLDKDAKGEITDTERTMLDAHLSRCETCRFEREVRADFADELGDDDSLSSQRLLELVQGLAPAEQSEEEVVEEHNNEEEDDEDDEEDDEDEEDDAKIIVVSSRGKRARRTASIVMLVAAALLVGGVATAGAGAGVWARIASVWESTPKAAASTATPSASTANTKKAPRLSANAREEELDAMMITDVAPSPSPVVVPVVPVVVPVVMPIAPSPPASPPETAASLFDSANEARRQGDYARTIALSRRLQQTHPSSREAHASHATVGRLLLDRGDAAGALASFDSYQARGSGALDEAVMVGRATALERLGRNDEARRAWSALLTAFPETPYAEHARTRVNNSTQR